MFTKRDAKFDVPPDSALSGSVESHAVGLRERTLVPFATSVLTGHRFHNLTQTLARFRSGFPLAVQFYFGLDDPYSYVIAQLLPRVLSNFRGDVRLEVRTVLAKDGPGLGSMERRYFRRDAACIASGLRVAFPDFEVEGRALEQPLDCVLQAAARTMIWAEQRVQSGAMNVEDMLNVACSVGEELWSHAGEAERVAALAAIAGPEHPLPDVSEAMSIIEANNAQRAAEAGYEGVPLRALGTFYTVDRMHHLLEDLARMTGREVDLSAVQPQPELLSLPHLPEGKEKKVTFYASFRSPYSAVLMHRFESLIESFKGWTWELKPVPPMITRGVPLSAEKRWYIALDCGRVHRRNAAEDGEEQQYMQMSDPLSWWGRAAAVYYHLLWSSNGSQDERKERAMRWMVAVCRAAFLQGMEYGSDQGLIAVAAKLGIPAEEVSNALAQDHEKWRTELKSNVDEMNSKGVWGVPSIAVQVDGAGGEMTTWWGQDRIWVAQELIKRVDGDVVSRM